MRLFLSALVLAGSFGIVQAAEPIIGNWRIPNGETASIRPCAGGYCIRAETGKYKGKSVGRFAGSGLSYAGEITDPTNDKTYDGTGTIRGTSLTLKGCAYKVFCRSQTWTKQ